MTENPYDPSANGTDTPREDVTGPDGTENIDRILELERERDASGRSDDAADMPAELGEEDVAAAEQGNRAGDEMLTDQELPDGRELLDEVDEPVDAFEDEPFAEDDPLRRDR
ncbi:hypothetical protein V1260_04345 [Brachybacterium sp. J144]|uniref:hypothetical protein n=1 Tax=Brachybacterium sp. J144 TaxID=3116487 RepID=UPI002E7810C4|nr:hypothetical protein [Brachybacterium sp. J144]MEE1650013.1 hypothetical protein [Brachybacterium sp. J144]